jgi:hypothetical protein
MATITLTQFVYPFGEQRETSVELPDDVCEMAKNQILSCEMMPNNFSQVVFYSRKKDWEEEDEELMFADNGPGRNSPAKALEKLIRLVDKK